MKRVPSQVQLIVAADEPALFFSSVEAAEGYLEAVDVTDGVYTAVYGPDGQAFSIEAVARAVRIHPLSGVFRAEALKHLLRDYLHRIGSPEDDAELPTLLAKFATHISA